MIADENQIRMRQEVVEAVQTCLNKNDMSPLKAMIKPPPFLLTVTSTLVDFAYDTQGNDWQAVKKLLFNNLKHFIENFPDIDKMTRNQMKVLQHFIDLGQIQTLEDITSKCRDAEGLGKVLLSLVEYYKLTKNKQPPAIEDAQAEFDAFRKDSDFLNKQISKGKDA